MNDRRCPYCPQLFQPSRFHPQQFVCGRPDCQLQRRRDYHRRKIATDPEYAQVVRDSRRKWRDAHRGYQKNYWQTHPAAAQRNRERQQQRDQKRRVRKLVKNNSALDLKCSPAQVWLVGPAADVLVKNTPLVFPAALPYNQPMLNADRLNEIHRLYHGEHWSMRKIARHLHLARKTLRKYLHSPVQASARRPRTRKIDPFKSAVAGLLEQDPTATAVVILQRLRPLGYEGGITLLRAYVSQLRSPRHPPRAFVRMEPSPGERCEIDWGHFGTLDYAGDKRKLYAFCLVEGHSRMLYVEFTHSQSFETFVRCHLHAFQALGGVARECWYDNLLTVVAEHVGTLVRFNPRFLAFARECDFYPRACNPAAGWEKGKVERGGVGYVRQNFWPLRQFTHLSDVNRQVREWLDQVANQRLHRETRERPSERFRPDCLRPLPALIPDYRYTVDA